jgi:hypothetical protein
MSVIHMKSIGVTAAAENVRFMMRRYIRMEKQIITMIRRARSDRQFSARELML